jgi:uncharacterized protein YfaS (alpha-2-macroglobulin family)
MQQLEGHLGNGMLRARVDSLYSISANAFHSNISGQAFISHLPPAAAAQPLALIESDSRDIPIRRDFSDSAYWNARVRTDAEGRARVKLELPDSLTNWRIVVTAISQKMHVGQTSTSFRTFKPIMVWPMVPRIFTEGDKVDLYASVHNRTDKAQWIDVSLQVENGKILTGKQARVRVPAQDNVPVYWRFQPEHAGFTEILMSARCAAGSDASLKRLPVRRLAAEQEVTHSGFATPPSHHPCSRPCTTHPCPTGFCKGSSAIAIPAGVALGDSVLEITLMPSLVDDMQHSLDYLVEYPHGCVEQTMSRFLPAIKVAQTLDRARIESPALRDRLPGVVDAGIKRLLQLQQADGGWGWHGNGQTHEMMTPYALYGLLQAEQAGYPIPSQEAITRGLSRLQSFIHSMGENQAADRIYCMYVYSHREDLPREWWQLVEELLDRDRLSDYALAMALEMTVNKGGKERRALADRLAAALYERAVRSSDTVYWQSAGFSRWGDDRFEITAAVLKALTAYNPDHELIAPSIVFFATTKTGNRWSSTKATAMVIYAMSDYLAAQDDLAGDKRSVTVQVNNGRRHTVLLESGQVPTIRVPGDQLHHGENMISFTGHGPVTMYRAAFRYWKEGRDIEPMEQGLVVSRQLWLLDNTGRQVRKLEPGDVVPRGSYLESLVSVQHKHGQPMRYVLVENPKPASCEILPASDTRFNQSSTAFALREDKTRGVVYHHEQTGSSITDRCVLHAELAGEYAIPPAMVELMYETQTRGHSGTFHLKVAEEMPTSGAAVGG